MTIQDLNNILTIMEEKSINKAAAKLFISQPSLSKCIKKVEQEYEIVLFERSKGSSLTVTEEGMLFREMAQNMMNHHRMFEYQLKQMHTTDEKTIVLGCTIQRAYSLASPIMQWIYKRYPGYNMELRALPSTALREELIAGKIDMALLSNTLDDNLLYGYPVSEEQIRIYLRKGSPAAEAAIYVPGEPYPVLPLEALRSEVIVENARGTGGRKSTELLMEKSGVQFEITEQSLYSLRVAMVNAGYASMFTTDESLTRQDPIDKSRIYSMPEHQRIAAHTYLVCRKGFQNRKKYAIIREAALSYYRKSDEKK